MKSDCIVFKHGFMLSLRLLGSLKALVLIATQFRIETLFLYQKIIIRCRNISSISKDKPRTLHNRWQNLRAISSELIKNMVHGKKIPFCNRYITNLLSSVFSQSAAAGGSIFSYSARRNCDGAFASCCFLFLCLLKTVLSEEKKKDSSSLSTPQK